MFGEKEVTIRIKLGWLIWRNASRIFCDKQILTRLKEKFYKMVIRLVMLYGTGCWTVKKQYIQKMNIT